MKDNKQKLFEIMSKIDKSFKPKLNENNNFDSWGELEKLINNVWNPNANRVDYNQIDEWMEKANNILNGYGVEALTDENAYINNYYYNTIALYVNMGDSYDKTIVFDTRNSKFLITSWGDFYEQYQSENIDS